MHVKLVALADEPAVRKILEDPDFIPKTHTKYSETLFMHPKGVYGAPDVYAIRVWNEEDEKALLVHLGHDLRNQKEKQVQTGHKEDLEYKLYDLGYLPVGSYEVEEHRGRYKEFSVLLMKIMGNWYVTVEKDAKDTEEFEERQRRAYRFLRDHGVENLLDVDVRGSIILRALEGAKNK